MVLIEDQPPNGYRGKEDGANTGAGFNGSAQSQWRYREALVGQPNYLDCGAAGRGREKPLT